MGLLVQVLYAIALLTFPVACLLLHLRLRNRASALLLSALGANALWIGWAQSALTQYWVQPVPIADSGTGINAATVLGRLDEFEHARQTLAACDAGDLCGAVPNCGQCAVTACKRLRDR